MIVAAMLAVICLPVLSAQAKEVEVLKIALADAKKSAEEQKTAVPAATHAKEIENLKTALMDANKLMDEQREALVEARQETKVLNDSHEDARAELSVRRATLDEVRSELMAARRAVEVAAAVEAGHVKEIEMLKETMADAKLTREQSQQSVDKLRLELVEAHNVRPCMQDTHSM